MKKFFSKKKKSNLSVCQKLVIEIVKMLQKQRKPIEACLHVTFNFYFIYSPFHRENYCNYHFVYL